MNEGKTDIVEIATGVEIETKKLGFRLDKKADIK